MSSSSRPPYCCGCPTRSSSPHGRFPPLLHLLILPRSSAVTGSPTPFDANPSEVRFAALEETTSDESESSGPASLGEAGLDDVRRLNRDVVEFYRQGDYGRALACALETVDFSRRTIGETHPEYASSLDNLAAVYKAMGRYGDAEQPPSGCPGNPEEDPGGERSRLRDKPQQPRRFFTSRRGDTARPSRCTGRPSISSERKPGKKTFSSPLPSTTWLPCTKPWAITSGWSRFTGGPARS